MAEIRCQPVATQRPPATTEQHTQQPTRLPGGAVRLPDGRVLPALGKSLGVVGANSGANDACSSLLCVIEIDWEDLTGAGPWADILTNSANLEAFLDPRVNLPGTKR